MAGFNQNTEDDYFAKFAGQGPDEGDEEGASDDDAGAGGADDGAKNEPWREPIAQLGSKFDAINDKLEQLGRGFETRQQPPQQQQPQYFQPQPQYGYPQPQMGQQPNQPQSQPQAAPAPVHPEMQRHLQQQWQLNARRERQDLNQAVDRLREQYPDLDKYVTGDIRAKALEIVEQQGSFGQDWQGSIEGLYWRRKGPEQFKAQKGQSRQQQQQPADELEPRRGKSRSVEGAEMQVPPGGTSYQRQAPPEQKAQKDPGYVRAEKGFLGSLKGAGWR